MNTSRQNDRIASGAVVPKSTVCDYAVQQSNERTKCLRCNCQVFLVEAIQQRAFASIYAFG